MRHDAIVADLKHASLRALSAELIPSLGAWGCFSPLPVPHFFALAITKNSSLGVGDSEALNLTVLFSDSQRAAGREFSGSFDKRLAMMTNLFLSRTYLLGFVADFLRHACLRERNKRTHRDF